MYLASWISPEHWGWLLPATPVILHKLILHFKFIIFTIIADFGDRKLWFTSAGFEYKITIEDGFDERFTSRYSL
jgi:hypothetical protein